MSGRPWLLAETTWKTLREARPEVAVLPWGATEPHNLHLPYGTDTYETLAVASEAGRLAWEAGAAVLVLPAVPFGANEQQLDLTGTINLHPSTQAAVLADVIESMEAHAIPKLVVLNGHGGNDFRQIIREAQRGTPVFLSTLSWFAIPGTTDGFREPGDHAGEAETSLMMHLRPDLVLPLEQAGPGRARPWRLQAIRDGWAWAPRRWSEVSDDTGIGDPSAATVEKGAAYFELVTRRVADHLRDLAEADLGDLYG